MYISGVWAACGDCAHVCMTRYLNLESYTVLDGWGLGCTACGVSQSAEGVKKGNGGEKRRANEERAVGIAQEMVEGAEDDGSQPVRDWEYVAPSAIVEEYMENMYRLVAQL